MAINCTAVKLQHGFQQLWGISQKMATTGRASIHPTTQETERCMLPWNNRIYPEQTQETLQEDTARINGKGNQHARLTVKACCQCRMSAQTPWMQMTQRDSTPYNQACMRNSAQKAYTQHLRRCMCKHACTTQTLTLLHSAAGSPSTLTAASHFMPHHTAHPNLPFPSCLPAATGTRTVAAEAVIQTSSTLWQLLHSLSTKQQQRTISRVDMERTHTHVSPYSCFVSATTQSKQVVNTLGSGQAGKRTTASTCKTI